MRLLVLFFIFLINISLLSGETTIGVKRDSLLQKGNAIYDIGRQTPIKEIPVERVPTIFPPQMDATTLGVTYDKRRISDPVSCDASISDFALNNQGGQVVEVCPLAAENCGTEWEYQDGTSTEVPRAIKHPYEGVLTLGVDELFYYKNSPRCKVGFNCRIYTETASFTIEESSDIKNLKLVLIYVNDWIKVSINGSVVFVGPQATMGGYEGDRLIILPGNVVQYRDPALPGPNIGRCENIDIHEELNIDATKYLTSGLNTFKIETAVSGCGSGYAKFTFDAASEITLSCPENEEACGVTTNKIIPDKYSYYEYTCPLNVSSTDTNWFVGVDYGQDCHPTRTSIRDLDTTCPNKENNPNATCPFGDEDTKYICNSPTPPTNNCRRLNAVCNIEGASNQKCGRIAGGPVNAQYTNGSSQTLTNSENPYFKICKKNEILYQGKCLVDSDNNKRKDDFTGSCPDQYEQVILNNRVRCIRRADCPVNHGPVSENSKKCQGDTYEYERCLCPNEFEPQTTGGDKTDYVPSICPANNCFSGNIQIPRNTFRPLLKAKLKGGFKTEDYGDKSDTLCSDIGINQICHSRLTKIYTQNDGTSLCFKDALNNEGCIDIVDQCDISGDCSLDPGCSFTIVGEEDAITEPLGSGFGVQQLVVQDDQRTIKVYTQATTLLGEIQSTCDITGKVGHSQKPFSHDGHITSIKIKDSRISFWDSFYRGFIGAIDFMPKIPQQDINEGYEFIDKNIANLKEFILFTKFKDSIYAVHKDSIDMDRCKNLVVNTGFYVPQARGEEEYEILSALSFEGGFMYNGNNAGDISTSSLASDFNRPQGSCIIKKYGPEQKPIYLEKLSVREDVTENPQDHLGAVYQCSPYVCKDSQCQQTQCQSGYSGNILQDNDQDTTKCTDDICDYSKDFFAECGKYAGCDVSQIDIFEIEDEDGNITCEKATCPDGGYLKINDENIVGCEKMDCPQNSRINSDGVCIKKVYESSQP